MESEKMTELGAGSPWEGRSVLVTGGTGFVGRSLVRTLYDCGAHVVALVHAAPSESSPFSFFDEQDRTTAVHGQVEDYDFLKEVVSEYAPGVVFHLAAQAQVGAANQNPCRTFETNIRGTWNLLEAIRQTARPTRVIIASSEVAYSNSPELPYTEDLPLGALSPYGVSKSCSELLGRSYHHTYGLSVCVARCSNLYGDGDLNFSRIVPGTIQSLLRGDPPVIRSNGRLVRDYLYIADAVYAYLTLAEAMTKPGVSGEVFNFSSEQPVSVLEIVETISRLMGRQDLTPQILAEPSDETTVKHVSSVKAKTRLGWSARVPLDVGLIRTIQWYRNH